MGADSNGAEIYLSDHRDISAEGEFERMSSLQRKQYTLNLQFAKFSLRSEKTSPLFEIDLRSHRMAARLFCTPKGDARANALSRNCMGRSERSPLESGSIGGRSFCGLIFEVHSSWSLLFRFWTFVFDPKKEKRCLHPLSRDTVGP